MEQVEQEIQGALNDAVEATLQFEAGQEGFGRGSSLQGVLAADLATIQRLDSTGRSHSQACKMAVSSGRLIGKTELDMRVAGHRFDDAARDSKNSSAKNALTALREAASVLDTQSGDTDNALYYDVQDLYTLLKDTIPQQIVVLGGLYRQAQKLAEKIAVERGSDKTPRVHVENAIRSSQEYAGSAGINIANPFV